MRREYEETLAAERKAAAKKEVPTSLMQRDDRCDLLMSPDER